MFYINTSECRGCGACIPVCPGGALALEEGVAVIDQARCRACGACQAACPWEAIIEMTEPELAPATTPSRDTRLAKPATFRSRRWVSVLGAVAVTLGRWFVDELASRLAERRVAGQASATSSRESSTVRQQVPAAEQSRQHRHRHRRAV